ncbi:HAD-IIB family hydrolase, partial [Turicibacter sanguinis]|nr:HAD-IIB family hydrolase [Turicibacter sanguinis]
MAIKLICIDMDGTLLMDDHQVSEVDQAAIKAAVKQGVHVAITTGRVYNCARLYAKTIGLTTPIIASNGAFIGGTNGETIYENPLLIEDVRDFLEITTQHGLLAYLTANFGLISLQELPE